jgi:hypothetical protein
MVLKVSFVRKPAKLLIIWQGYLGWQLAPVGNARGRAQNCAQLVQTARKQGEVMAETGRADG